MMAGSNTTDEESDPRRKILRMVVCSLCYDAGFSSVQNPVVETLTEMLQSSMFIIWFYNYYLFCFVFQCFTMHRFDARPQLLGRPNENQISGT